MADATFDPTDIKQAAQRTDDAATTIENIQKGLYGEINALIGGGWGGPAAREFLKQFRNFDDEFRQVQNSLNTLHQKMVDTEIDYNRSEAEQTDAAAAMASIING